MALGGTAPDARNSVGHERTWLEVGAPPTRVHTGAGGPGRWFSAGDRLSVGVEAFTGMEPNDPSSCFWVESSPGARRRRGHARRPRKRARVQGRLGEPGAIAERGVPPEQILERLRPLLELPVELVLATHGGPTDRAAFERALA